jgi:hypothetical protein
MFSPILILLQHVVTLVGLASKKSVITVREKYINIERFPFSLSFSLSLPFYFLFSSKSTKTLVKTDADKFMQIHRYKRPSEKKN